METRAYLLHALSPLHPGTGQAADVVDLPIARMRSTGIPFVPGASVKGVLRYARRKGERASRLGVFGPETDDAGDHAGALVVGDARLLALPVRSFRGTFAWVSSPLLLELARRDLGDPPTLPSVGPFPGLSCARVGASKGDSASLTVQLEKSRDPKGKSKTIGRVFLEDLDLPAEVDDNVATWAAWLAPHVAPAGSPLLFARRLVVVDDETMSFLWQTATQIDTRVRLDDTTRTVATGALWVEESLPVETLLLGLLAADRSRRADTDLAPDKVLSFALPKEETLQFGGKATVGRGRCRVRALAPPKG